MQLAEHPLTWVGYGDSITQGALHTGLSRSWFELVQERVRYQLGRTGDLFINSAVAGWTAADGRANFRRHVERFSPDIVLLGFGANDVIRHPDGIPKVAADLGSLMTLVRSLGSQPVLQTPVPFLRCWPGHELVPLCAEAIRALSRQTGVALVDHHAEWDAAWGERDPVEWMSDPVHPNATGHLIMAKTTLASLGLGELEARSVQLRGT